MTSHSVAGRRPGDTSAGGFPPCRRRWPYCSGFGSAPRPWRPRAGASCSCKIRTIGAGRRRPGARRPEHGSCGRTSHDAAENGKGAVLRGAHEPPGALTGAGGGGNPSVRASRPPAAEPQMGERRPFCMARFQLDIQDLASGMTATRPLPAGAGLVDALRRLDAAVAAARRHRAYVRYVLRWGRECLIMAAVADGAARYVSCLGPDEIGRFRELERENGRCKRLPIGRFLGRRRRAEIGRNQPRSA